MKKTRSLLALTLTLLLLLSIGTCAFAEDAKFASTKQYLDDMAQLPGATCTLESDMLTIGNSTYEHVKVDYEGELSKYKSHFDVCFTEETEDMPIEILMSMTVIHFDPEKLADVLSEINAINASTTTIKLYVDTDKNAVMAEFYLLATSASVQDISLLSTGIFIGFTDQIYEILSKYDTDS